MAVEPGMRRVHRPAGRFAAMTLRLLGHIDLPEHRGAGGFDHADVHAPSDRLYVAHTGNDAVGVIDTARDKYVEAIPGLTAVAGALVSEARGLVFTSNRGETPSRYLRRMGSGAL